MLLNNRKEGNGVPLLSCYNIKTVFDKFNSGLEKKSRVFIFFRRQRDRPDTGARREIDRDAPHPL